MLLRVRKGIEQESGLIIISRHLKHIEKMDIDYRLTTLLKLGSVFIPQLPGFGEGCFGLCSVTEQLEGVTFLFPCYSICWI